MWENLNPFLPTVLKKISVIFYLKNLCPVEVPIPPPFNVMVIDADPTPFWIAVPGLLVLSLIFWSTPASPRARPKSTTASSRQSRAPPSPSLHCSASHQRQIAFERRALF